MIRSLQGPALLAIALCAYSPLAAQTVNFSPISPSVTLNATSGGNSAALTTTGSPTIELIQNLGPYTAWVALGSSGVAATTSNIPVLGGQTISVSLGSNTYIAAITAAGTSTTIVATSGAGTIAGGWGGTPTNGNPLYMYTSTGTVFVSTITTTTARSFAVPTGSTVCFIYAEGAAGRYRVDGIAPTLSAGVPLNNYDTFGAYLTLTANLSGFAIVAQSGTLNLVADCYK
jgi:hypothetical protein